MAALFGDQSLFEDLGLVKQYTQEIHDAIHQKPTKAPLAVLEAAQNRFLWQTKLMKMKMFREMGLMSQRDYERGIAVQKEKIRTGDPSVR